MDLQVANERLPLVFNDDDAWGLFFCSSKYKFSLFYFLFMDIFDKCGELCASGLSRIDHAQKLCHILNIHFEESWHRGDQP